MWKCTKCREQIDDTVQVCWSCGTIRDSEPGATATGAPSDGARRSIDQLIFVGLNGYALALDRDTGEIVWSQDKLKGGYVSLLLDGDRLIVSTNGYMFCLNPLTGAILWNNPLSGYGMGTPTSITSVRGPSSVTQMQQAAEVTARQAAAGS
jgi:outer membrane protein assembly factor BamB